ncbi:MAG: hypothetical protein COA86_07915 [Kangiella sp.]|nr:MAG: hypothetical protein COA86_07915 [Kangiella sp.]
MKKIHPKFFGIYIIFALFTNSLLANEQQVGEYTVHYNLFNSSMITPEVATQYKLKRSKNIALLNISVVRNSTGSESDLSSDSSTAPDKVVGVISNVFGQGQSLSGQHKGLAFREIREETAVYYIAQIPVFHGERLSFDIQVQPEKKGKLIPISFKQQIFIE